MKARVNGEERETQARTVAELLEELGIGLEAKGVAVALNERVVPRSRWAEEPLSAEDRVEIIRIVQGG